MVARKIARRMMAQATQAKFMVNLSMQQMH
jgi:hypothetical protein